MSDKLSHYIQPDCALSEMDQPRSPLYLLEQTCERLLAECEQRHYDPIRIVTSSVNLTKTGYGTCDRRLPENEIGTRRPELQFFPQAFKPFSSATPVNNRHIQQKLSLAGHREYTSALEHFSENPRIGEQLQAEGITESAKAGVHSIHQRRNDQLQQKSTVPLSPVYRPDYDLPHSFCYTSDSITQADHLTYEYRAYFHLLYALLYSLISRQV